MPGRSPSDSPWRRVRSADNTGARLRFTTAVSEAGATPGHMDATKDDAKWTFVTGCHWSHASGGPDCCSSGSSASAVRGILSIFGYQRRPVRHQSIENAHDFRGRTLRSSGCLHSDLPDRGPLLPHQGLVAYKRDNDQHESDGGSSAMPFAHSWARLACLVGFGGAGGSAQGADPVPRAAGWRRGNDSRRPDRSALVTPIERGAQSLHGRHGAGRRTSLGNCVVRCISRRENASYQRPGNLRNLFSISSHNPFVSSISRKAIHRWQLIVHSFCWVQRKDSLCSGTPRKP